MAITLTRGKFERINACADAHGVIAAAAMDQRGSLQKSIAKARGADATAADLMAFKEAVTRILTPHATAILMDPEFGLEAIKARAEGTGVLLAYEKTGYDVSVAGRLPDLLPEWSVKRLLENGADAIKILLYYNPDDDAGINTIKQAFVERIGAECAANDAPFFLEPIYYSEGVDDAALARSKPGAVTRYMEEFSRPRYGVDVLKVEVPFNIKYVAGSRAFAGDSAYTMNDAMRLFREAADAAQKPFIYLSAGVTNEVFLETLELAAQAGTKFSGVLCGRATWQEGIPVFAREGYEALVGWLEEKGVANIEALNAVLAKGAQPWWNSYGGRTAIQVVDQVIS
ncbi:MAG: tagatose 1,6-diphosphate aldolase [Caldilineaceae bacterium]